MATIAENTATMTQEQARRWDAVIFTRRSVRTYDGTPLTPEAAASLATLQPELPGSPRARHVLVEGADVTGQVLTGLVGSYGRIIGAPALLFFIAQMDDPLSMLAAGYVGQQVLLEATALGLATCWVGGAFRRDLVSRYVDLAPGEEVVCVSPVGTAAVTSGLRRMHDLSMKLLVPGRGQRKPLAEILHGHPTEPWQEVALEAARWAPSSVNRQPWRFRVEGGRIVVSHAPSPLLKQGAQDPRSLDCGIAMTNFAVAARARGVEGRWELIGRPDELAKFQTT